MFIQRLNQNALPHPWTTLVHLLFAALTLIYPVIGHGANLTQSEQDWIKKHDGKIRVAVPNLPPIAFQNPDTGQFHGIAIDFAREFERQMGLHLTLQLYPSFSEALHAGRNGRADAVLTLVRTEAREAFFSFTRPYYTVGNSIVVQNDSELKNTKSLKDLKFKRVAVLLDSAVHENLKQNHSDIEIVPMAQEDTAIAAVALGQVDAMIGELPRVVWYANRNKIQNIAAVADAGIDYPISIGIRKDWPELVSIMNQAIAEIPPDEKARIEKAWSDYNRIRSASNWQFFNNHLGLEIALFVLVSIALAYSLALKKRIKRQAKEQRDRFQALEHLQKELISNEARFRELVSISSDWFWETDDEFRYTLFEGGMLSNSKGLNASLALGKTCWELSPDGSPSEAWEAHRHRLERHEKFVDLTYWINTPLTTLWISTSGLPVFDPNGRFVGYRGVARDITSEMAARQNDQVTRERMDALLNGAYSMLGLLTPEGLLIDVNNRALEFAGTHKKEVLALPFADTTWGANEPAAQSKISEAIVEANRGSFVRFDMQIKDKNRAMHWIDFSVSPIHNEEGKINYLVVEGRDITEIKHTNETMNVLLERTSSVFGDKFFQSVVKNLSRILGLKYAFIGEISENGDTVHTIALCVDGEIAPNFDYELADTPCDNVIEFGCCIYPDSVSSIFPDDKLLQQMSVESYLGVPIFGGSQKPRGILVGLHDAPLQETVSARRLMELFAIRCGTEMERLLHERKIKALNSELEERVNLRTSQLAEANKELESFSYSVSHDLRAPLRHVSGFIDLVQPEADEKLSDEGKRYLQVIRESATRMSNLIDDLLSFSRIGRTELAKTRFDLNTLVREVILEQTQLLPERSIEWKIAPLPHVEADRSLLRQVYANLIGNAIKYSQNRRPPVIEIFTQPHPDWGLTIFAIRDNGAGFSMKYVSKLFGVFQRLHSSSQFEGTGIGLANVKRIIDKHGGKIWAEGEVEKGATFYFTLPGNRAEANVTETEEHTSK